MIRRNLKIHSIEDLKSHLFAFAKFGLVGSITAAIYFLVVWVADVLFGVPYVLGVSLAYFVSTIFHFQANRHLTFASALGYQRLQIIRYLILWVINYLITMLVVILVAELFHLSPFIGVCISVLFTMCGSYMLSRYWVFKAKEECV